MSNRQQRKEAKRLRRLDGPNHGNVRRRTAYLGNRVMWGRLGEEFVLFKLVDMAADHIEYSGEPVIDLDPEYPPDVDPEDPLEDIAIRVAQRLDDHYWGNADIRWCAACECYSEERATCFACDRPLTETGWHSWDGC